MSLELYNSSIAKWKYTDVLIQCSHIDEPIPIVLTSMKFQHNGLKSMNEYCPNVLTPMDQSQHTHPDGSIPTYSPIYMIHTSPKITLGPTPSSMVYCQVIMSYKPTHHLWCIPILTCPMGPHITCGVKLYSFHP